MPPADPADPARLAELQALLHDPGGDRPLGARLADAVAAAGPGPLADFLTTLAQQEGAATLAGQVALARAQHRLAHGATPPPEPGGRLSVEGRAVGQMLAKALAQVPGWYARRIFDGADYLARNRDLQAAGVDPLAHYIAGGAAEGRLPGGLATADPGLATAFAPADINGFLAETEPQYPDALRPALRADALHQAARDGPTISVVLPCWNRAHVVAGAVHSALTQAYMPLEVIVVDDGSTDGSADLLAARFAGPVAESTLHILRAPHKGVSGARNAGLAVARGDVIAYLDSDNLWEPDHLLYLAATFAVRPATQSAYTGVVRHNLDDGWSDVIYAPFDRAALETENFIDLNGFAHRRALCDTQGGFDEGLDRLVDWDLVLRLSETHPAQPIPVLGAHHVLAADVLGNITVTRDAAPNLARIQARLAARPARPLILARGSG